MQTTLRIYRERAHRHDCNSSEFIRLLTLADTIYKQEEVTLFQLNSYKQELQRSDIRDYDNTLMDAYYYAREAIYELEKKVIKE